MERKYFFVRFIFSAGVLLILAAKSTQGLEIRFGKALINETDTQLCSDVTFPRAFQQSTGLKVHLSLGYGETFIKVHNPSALWVTAITSRGFTLCKRESGERYNGAATVHWLAVRGGGLEQGEVTFPEFSAGTSCQNVQPTGRYSSTPRVFVSLVGPDKNPHNSAHYAWVKTASTGATFNICVHERTVFAGPHSGIKAVWFAFEENGTSPWNFTSRMTFDPSASLNRENNYANCQVVNYTKPFYAPPVVLLTADHHSNESRSPSSSQCSAMSVWTEEVTRKYFRVCLKSLPIGSSNQSIGTNYIIIGDVDPCLAVTCDYFAVCRAFSPHDARCICVTMCPSYEETVCSSNGTTFRNKCFYELEMCRLRGNHTIAHPGDCRGLTWQRGSAQIVSTSRDRDTACTTQLFDPLVSFYKDKQVHVQLTVNHANTSNLDYVHDAMASWAENINFKGFDACVTTAGRNTRARATISSVDWFAYQGAPAGSVADRTRISEWWTGTKCQTIQLPRGSFKAAPTVLLTAEHISQGDHHDAATLWAEDITTTSLKVCLRELQNFDGFHQDIHVSWLAFEELHRPVFTEKGKVYFANTGQPSLQYNGAFCKDLKYTKTYERRPSIILSTNHKSTIGSVSPASNGISTWIEYMNTTGFRICLKELYVNKYEPLTVNYLLLFDICSPGWRYFKGLCYYTSQSCKKWTGAETACRAVSGHLATVQNQEDNVHVQQQLSGEKGWIGLNDRSVEEDFRWSSRRRVNWTYWAPNQPNDLNATQDCVHTLGPKYDYHWNDVSCETCHNYTCSKDYDECRGERNSCHEDATCTNTYRSYSCQCKVGYSGNGQNCTDIDECLSAPCSNNATCANTKGSFRCACVAGFSGNGFTCADVDECAAGTHDCDVNAVCTNTVGSFTCQCKRRYYGDGKNCVLIPDRGLEQSTILRDYGNTHYVNALNGYLSPVLQSLSSSHWVRCWHAASDGWNVDTTFHAQCDNKGPTVTIVRVGSYVFGGYSRTSWDSSNTYSYSSGSFLFSLYGPNGYSTVKQTIWRRAQYAIYRHSGYGPSFGGGADLHISQYASSNTGSYTNRGHTYYDPGYYFAGSMYFTPNDVEVYYETTS